MDAYNFTRLVRIQFCVYCLVSSVGWLAYGSEPPLAKNVETVYVAVEQARLYAGPSSDFYPTGNVARGAALEVYHRTSTGWLGVRPTQGSFSWVPASQAYLLPGGRVIEITDANAVSWIGTELGSAKQYRWQVQLNVGEQLGVLGEASVKNGPDEREALWFKVSPPAGEFRWIEESAVSKTPVQPSTLSPTSPNEQVAAAQSENPMPTAISASEVGRVSQASFNAASKQTNAPENASSKPAPQSQATRRSAGQVKTKSKPGSEWDGWYAFEMSDDGVKTPFLDKLSGRDRGRTAATNQRKTVKHDPLDHDPFSLSMAGEASVTPTPEELTSSIQKSREWRDPRSLREARLASNTFSNQSKPLEKFVDQFDRAVAGVSGVLPAGGERPHSKLDRTGRHDREQYDTERYDGATSAEYENPARSSESAGIGTSGNPSAAVNWYGLSESKTDEASNASQASRNAAGTSASSVVTSAQDVAELQVALNNMVAMSTGPWQLAPLAERAKYFIEHGATAIDRGQARLLLERIEAFQNLAARSQQLASQQFSSAQLSGQPAVQSASYVATPAIADATSQPAPGASHFDATGWLVPVHSASPDQPTHAITNDTGDIVAYVSPIAGLNLDRYRNQAVGITGLRGYLPKLHAAHIQAQRVSRIR